MNKAMIKRTCPFCGTKQTLWVKPAALDAYNEGALAQDVFPDLSDTERETIISGMCPDCQAKIFGED